jgi:hypothetical protein
VILAASCTSSPDDGDKASSAAVTDSIAADVQVLKIQGNDALRFRPSSVVVKPGRVRVIFTVAGKTPQTFTSTVLRADSGNVPAARQLPLTSWFPLGQVSLL